MRSIIFANYIARDTKRLGPTMDVDNTRVRLMGSLVLNLWDCGGQAAFMESYFDSQKDQIFKNVEVLIHVFDIYSNEVEKDLQAFTSCIDAMVEHSKDAKVFVLIHKMDLIPENLRDEKYEAHASTVSAICKQRGITPNCFRTSIWDETLYKAWSDIVMCLIPNVDILKNQLDAFQSICEADEIVLFEKATFLVIAHSTCKEHKDVHRFEKISNIIKQFKLSCSKSSTRFSSLEVRTSTFTAIIESFTQSTYVMVIMSDPEIEPAATHINILSGRAHFDSVLQASMPTS